MKPSANGTPSEPKRANIVHRTPTVDDAIISFRLFQTRSAKPKQQSSQKTMCQHSCPTTTTTAPVVSRRRVRFAETPLYQYGTALDHPEGRRSNIWFDGREMRHIKMGAVHLGKEGAQQGLGSMLSNVYGRNDADTISIVETWAITCAHRRGLERFISPNYALRRMESRKKHIVSVLKAQTRMRDEEKITNLVYISIVIGRLSSALSINARNFSRVLGMADESASTCLYTTLEPQPKTPTPGLREKKPSIVTRGRSPDSIMDMMNPMFGIETIPTDMLLDEPDSVALSVPCSPPVVQ